MSEYGGEFPAGLFGCFVPTNRHMKRLLHIIDVLISVIIVTPLVVAHWYGTWIFMDRHPEYFPIWPTLIFGFSWHLLMVLTRHRVHDTVKRPENIDKTVKRSISSFLFTKVYIYVFSISGVLTWRALFVLINDYGMIFFEYFSSNFSIE